MKQTKTTLMLMLAFLLTGMVSCTKTINVKPDNVPTRQMAVKADVTVDMSNNGPVMEGNEAIFTAVINSTSTVNCGKISLQKYDAVLATWVAVDGAGNMDVTNGTATFTIAVAAMSDNGSYRWHYVASGSGCDFKEAKSNGLDLVVIEACSGLILTATETTGNCGTGAYSVNYTVKACGGDYTNLKLQGGLTAGCTSITYTAGGTLKTTNKNSIISWNAGTLL
ncbi:MAG: hypothetical protein ACXWEY_08150 [Bacteroidia bacterium]